MDTERLIRTLAENVEPVRPLRHPWVRALAWTAGGALYVLLLVAVMSPRDDLAARMRDLGFLIEQAAALLTGVTAAIAAFATAVPGSRRNVVLVPLVSAVAWIGIVSVGAVREFQLAGPEVVLQADWGCVWTVLLGAAVPAGLMATMLRRGAPLTPYTTAALGGLAAAGIGNLGVCLFHPHSSDLVVLVWHCGTVLVVAALAGTAGGQLLRWPPRRTRALMSV